MTRHCLGLGLDLVLFASRMNLKSRTQICRNLPCSGHLLKLSILFFVLQYTPLTAVTETAAKQKPVPKVIKSLAELRQEGNDSLALKIIREVSGLSGDVANWPAIILALSNLVRSQSGQDAVTEGKVFIGMRISSLHWTILVLFCVLFVQWSKFPSAHF